MSIIPGRGPFEDVCESLHLSDRVTRADKDAEIENTPDPVQLSVKVETEVDMEFKEFFEKTDDVEAKLDDIEKTLSPTAYCAPPGEKYTNSLKPDVAGTL
jgi:tetrahydromethanopterin S-methyltransferase subunit B